MIRFGLRPLFTAGGVACGMIGTAVAWGLWAAPMHGGGAGGPPVLLSLVLSGALGGLVGWSAGTLLGRQLADLARQLHHAATEAPVDTARWVSESRMIGEAFRMGVAALNDRLATSDALIRQLETQLAERTERVEAINTQLLQALDERTQCAARLEQTMLQDDATGLMNQRWFFLRAELERERALRKASNLTVILLAIDHFKRMVDAYGLTLGNEAIRQVALRLKRSSRAIDVCGRFGGEQFALLLVDSDEDVARIVVARLRAALADAAVATPDGPVAITASFGVALWSQAVSMEALVANAGTALYSAKRAGRNQIEVWRA